MYEVIKTIDFIKYTAIELLITIELQLTNIGAAFSFPINFSKICSLFLEHYSYFHELIVGCMQNQRNWSKANKVEIKALKIV